MVIVPVFIGGGDPRVYAAALVVLAISGVLYMIARTGKQMRADIHRDESYAEFKRKGGWL